MELEPELVTLQAEVARFLAPPTVSSSRRFPLRACGTLWLRAYRPSSSCGRRWRCAGPLWLRATCGVTLCCRRLCYEVARVVALIRSQGAPASLWRQALQQG